MVLTMRLAPSCGLADATFDPETYEAATGITHVDGKAYLFDENGVEILRSRTEVINGKKYWFQPVDGSLIERLVQAWRLDDVL